MIKNSKQEVQESSSTDGINSSHHLPYLFSKAGAPWLRKVLHIYTYLVPFLSKHTPEVLIIIMIRNLEQDVQESSSN